MNKLSKLKLVVILIFAANICIPQLNAEPNGPSSFGFSFNIPVGTGETSDVLDDGFGFGLDFFLPRFSFEQS